MSEKQLEFISEAVQIVRTGLTGKMISPDKTIQVYKCGTVIRIDIKEVNCENRKHKTRAYRQLSDNS